jgi:UDP-N-acetyl-D-galactosamine dehydrogenase
MKITIIGSGYVGLPLAISFSKHYLVTSYDINKKRINELKKGIDNNFQHSKKEILHKRLKFSSNPQSIKNKNVYIITVPTPIKQNNIPDLSMLKIATILVAKVITKNSYIIFESTTYPGCTEEICIPLLEKYSKLKLDKDFFVAYSPERINPGDKINILSKITKIVGANNIRTLNEVKKLYSKVCRSVHLANSIQIAESAKVIENIQRDVNIALVNEISVLLNKLNIPTMEVLKAAKTKWNFHQYFPGLVGGHCISVDPYYLSFKAKQHNFKTKLILSGRETNEAMGRYVAKKTIKLLAINKVNLSTARVAVLGYAYKDNIPDIRNTKILQVINELKKNGIIVNVFDSLVKNNAFKKIKIYDFKNLKKFKYDAIILAVSHDIFLKKISYYKKFYKDDHKKIFIDVKNNYSVTDLKKEKFIFFQL